MGAAGQGGTLSDNLADAMERAERATRMRHVRAGREGRRREEHPRSPRASAGSRRGCGISGRRVGVAGAEHRDG